MNIVKHTNLEQVDSFRDFLNCAKKAGLEFQINTTVTKINLKELPYIPKFAVELGAVAFHPFLLVPTGRGKEMADQELSPQQYEETLNWVCDQRGQLPLNLKPTCAPHDFRILRQRPHAEGKKNYAQDAWNGSDEEKMYGGTELLLYLLSS